MKDSAFLKNEPSVNFSHDSEKDLTPNNKYIVAFQSKCVDKFGNTLDDQIVLSVSNTFGSTDNTMFIRLTALSMSAKEELKKPIISLPQLIYSSIQYVAEDMARLKTAKSEKDFSEIIKSYNQSIKEANNMVSLNGFEIEKEFYVFEGGKTVKK